LTIARLAFCMVRDKERSTQFAVCGVFRRTCRV
jgi:hypothetical protein